MNMTPEFFGSNILHRTVVLNDKMYVDLWTLDGGNTVTHIMKKSGEPNLFKATKTLEGDKVQEVIDKYNKTKE